MKLSPRWYLRSYVLALGAIAALAIGSQVVVRGLIHRSDADSSAINQAGRQRMLCQRIVKASLVLRDADSHIVGVCEAYCAGPAEVWDEEFDELYGAPLRREFLARLEDRCGTLPGRIHAIPLTGLMPDHRTLENLFGLFVGTVDATPLAERKLTLVRETSAV